MAGDSWPRLESEYADHGPGSLWGFSGRHPEAFKVLKTLPIPLAPVGIHGGVAAGMIQNGFVL